MLDNIGGKFKDYAPLVLRMGLAVLVIVNGAGLLRDVGSRQIGELVVAGVFMLGGLLVLIGFLTRWAAAALIIVLLIQILDYPRLRAITDSDHQYLFAALMMSFAIYFAGGGEMSVDLKQKRKQEK